MPVMCDAYVPLHSAHAVDMLRLIHSEQESHPVAPPARLSSNPLEPGWLSMSVLLLLCFIIKHASIQHAQGWAGMPLELFKTAVKQ